MVVVINPLMNDVHPGQKVATVQGAEVVSPRAGEATPTIDPSWFFTGDSPAPETWKIQLRKKLQARTNVFSLHNWDVGKAKQVEHQICLSNPRPFRECSHHIPQPMLMREDQ